MLRQDVDIAVLSGELYSVTQHIRTGASRRKIIEACAEGITEPVFEVFFELRMRSLAMINPITNPIKCAIHEGESEIVNLKSVLESFRE